MWNSFWMNNLSFYSIYFFNQSYFRIVICSHEYLFYTLSYYQIRLYLLCCSNHFNFGWAIGRFFSWLLYFFDIPHHWGLFRVFLFYCFALFFVCLFWELPYFLVLQDAPGSFHIFLALVLESDVPPRSAGFFYCRMVKHKTKQQDLNARCLTFYEALLVIYNHFFLKKKRATFLNIFQVTHLHMVKSEEHLGFLAWHSCQWQSRYNDRKCTQARQRTLFITFFLCMWCESDMKDSNWLECNVMYVTLVNNGWYHQLINLSKLWEMVKDRAAWRAAGHGVTEYRTWLSDWTTTCYIILYHTFRKSCW